MQARGSLKLKDGSEEIKVCAERAEDSCRPVQITSPERRAGLSGRVEAFLVRHRARFGGVHAAMAVVFLALVAIPVFFPFPADDDTAFTNIQLLARFFIWGLWFPLMFLSVVLFGRLWCGVLCPQGALSEFMSRRGLNRPIPRWMRWKGLPIASFVIVTIFGQLVGVRDYSLAALEVLGGMMLLAALTGFIYTKDRRAWCRHLCPAGPLLGVFSRLGAVGIDKNGGAGTSAACPTFINTQTKASSSNCIACMRCVNPGSESTLKLKLRRPGREIEEIGKREPEIWEVLFLFGATGLALGAFHWQANPIYIAFKQGIGNILLGLGLGDFIGGSGPWWVMANYPQAGEVFNWLDFISISSFMLLGLSAALAVLFALTSASALLAYGRNTTLKRVAELGYLYAPVALISIVIGLGQMLFQSLGGLGLAEASVRSIQMAFFAGGALWSVYLAYRISGRLGLHLVPSIAGVGFVAWAWKVVIF